MRFNRLDLNLLVALDALLAERSVSRAAARMSLSPSATSDALARLREYFGDELLVQVGRRMEPTPRGEALRDPVREMLVCVESTIVAPPSFDPEHSRRLFRIFASDYTQMVLAPALMQQVAARRCSASFEFLPQVTEPGRELERGDADLLVMPESLLTGGNPHRVLYEEHFVCVVWQGSPLAQGTLTRERYLAARHVVMRPQGVRADSYEDWFLRRHGLQREVAATSYGFANAAGLLLGTPWVATMHERLARQLARVWPLQLRPCPLEIPPMRQAVQWHAFRNNDPGIAWLLDQLGQAARSLPPPGCEVPAG